MGSAIGKVFLKILEQRMRVVVEREGWLGETQCGFRKGCSTEDHLFTLMGPMEMVKKKRRRLWMVFVDLRKAYDRVWRGRIWECLQQRGFGGKLIRILQTIYDNQRRKVRVEGGFTEWIRCEVGLKQGCILSPLLFAIFVADLQERWAQTRRGVLIGGKG